MSSISIKEPFKNTPKVTIGIPTYNRSNYLKEALDSALRQSHKNLEIIVSNNGSTDETKKILANYCDERIVVTNQEKNSGVVKNFNFCLSRATGDFFLLLSDDDILEDNAIEELINGFIDDSISVSYGPCIYIDKDGSMSKNGLRFKAPQIESGKKLIIDILKYKKVAFPSATMYKTLEAKKKGGYPDVGTSIDFALLLLVALNKSVFFTSNPVAKYRIHNQSVSLSEEAILSYQSFFEWSKSSSIINDEIKTSIQKYIIQQIYRWGRHNALRVNQNESILALSELNKISPNKKWRWIFLILNFKPLRWLAAFKRNLFQRT